MATSLHDFLVAEWDVAFSAFSYNFTAPREFTFTS